MTETSATAELQPAVSARSPADKLRLILPLAGLGVALGLLYYPTFKWLVTQVWWRDKEYSHGFLVPFIAAYLAWVRRDYLASLAARPAPLAGGAVILFSAALLFTGHAGAFTLAESVSFLLVLPGIVLFLWGWTHLKAVALPLAYLQFMVPWMEEFIDRIHWPFQLLSAKIGVGVLRAFGYPVFHNGQYIALPAITLEVARECSGLRFLMAIVALGIPLVYLTQRTWKRAIAVILSAVAIAILANGLRVALAGISATYYGEEMLHGPWHMFQGWFVSQVGIVVLFIFDWLAARKSDGRPKLYQRLAMRATAPGRTAPSRRRVALILVFLFGVGIWLQFFAATTPVPLKRPLAYFPAEIGAWYGASSQWFAGNEAYPGASAELSRVYRNAAGKPVYLYIGYFEVQRPGRTMINSRAGNPLRAAATQRSLPLDVGTRDALGLRNINVSFPTLRGTPYAAVYWYRFPSGAVSGRYRAKLIGLLHATLRRHDNAAVIVLAQPLDRGVTQDAAVAELLAFARGATPALRDYIP
jgi:EpsI family protein